MRRFWRRFRRDERGSTTVDTVMILSPLLLAVFAVADLAIVYLSIESSQKGAQLGARLAVTRAAIHADVPDTNRLNAANGREGEPCFNPDGNDACEVPNPEAWVCDGSALTFQCDADEFRLIVDEIRRLYSRIGPEDVTIEYRYRRLGYANGPFQPEVRVTIAQRDYVRTVRSLMPFVSQIRPAVAINYAEDMQ